MDQLTPPRPMDKSDKELLSVPEQKNLFFEAYSNTSDMLNWKTVAVGTAVIGGVALGAKGISRLINGAASAGEATALRTADTASAALVAEAGKRASAGALTIEGKAIPGVAREKIAENTLSNEAAFQSLKTGAAEKYAHDMTQIAKFVPQEMSLKQAGSLSSVAEGSLTTRALLTKERTGADQIAKEIERLTTLNPGLAKDAVLNPGTTLKMADDAFIKKVSDDLVFKHVPPIGQFMKGTGKISEEQIVKALEIQKGMAPEAERKLLGQILVDNKLALQADIDLAFARQTEMKAALQKIRDHVLAK